MQGLSRKVQFMGLRDRLLDSLDSPPTQKKSHRVNHRGTDRVTDNVIDRFLVEIGKRNELKLYR